MSGIFVRVGQNSLVLLLVNLSSALTGFAMAALLGRGLGHTGFGQYSLVLSWLLSLMTLAEFGLSTVLTRDLAASPAQTRRYLFNSLAGKSLLALPVAALLLGAAPVLAVDANPHVSQALRWGILFVCAGLAFSSLTAVFKAQQVMWPILAATMVGQLMLIGGSLALVWLAQPLKWLIGWAGFSQLAQLALIWMIFFLKNGAKNGVAGQRACEVSPHLFSFFSLSDAVTRFRLNFRANSNSISIPFIKHLFFKAWPFALAGLLAVLQLRANIFLLAYLQGNDAVGWYAAAGRFIDAGRQLPGAFYAALLPALAALAKQSGRATTLAATLRYARLALLFFGLAAAGGAALLAEVIITGLYGPGFEPAIFTLQLLALALIPTLQNNMFTIYLYAHNDERFVNRLIALGILLNVGLCGLLIPGWGAPGAALALLLTETALYPAYRKRINTLPSHPAHPDRGAPSGRSD